MSTTAPGRFQNPFPGLRPFRTEEHHLFFGREEQTGALVALLREHRFLAVVGTSGSGKSSLVRAGLIPALHRGSMARAGSGWEVVVLRPGGNPIQSLARGLLDADLYEAADPDALPRLRATLTRSLFGLVDAVRQSSSLEASTNLLVVVDQFEEVFRFRQQGLESEETAAAFVNLLLAASQAEGLRIYVVLTMRSDYLGDCSQIPGLAEAVNRGEYLIPRLNRDQRRDAIEKPVGVGGATIAPRLVQHMLNDLGDDPDQLPVLQHALMRTWEAWLGARRDGEPLDLAHYEATGGMASALSRHADEVFEGLPGDDHRRAAERIFKGLTVKGGDNRGIRRPTRLARLARIVGASEEVVTAVVEAYRRPGVTFLMPGVRAELAAETVVDLSHESLMRIWGRLRGWVEEEAQSARIYRRLAETAALREKGEAGLYHDPDLSIAMAWRDQSRPNEAWADQYGGGLPAALEFLERSLEAAEARERAIEEARRRELEQAKALAEAERRRLEVERRSGKRLKLLVAGLGVVAALAVAAFFVAIKARQEAVSNAALAQSNAALARTKEEAATKAAGDAERAAGELQRTLVQSDFQQGAELIEEGKGAEGLTHLARALRTDPRHLPGGMRALSTLASGRFPLRTFPPLEQEKVITTFRFNEKEELLFTSDATDDASAGPTQRFVWDGRTGKRLYSLAAGRSLGGDTDWTEDGKYLVALDTGAHAIRSWEGRSGKELEPIAAEGIEAIRLGQHPREGGLVVGRFADGTLQVWKAGGGKPLTARLGRAGRAIDGFGFTPDGRRIHALFSDATIQVWEAADGTAVAEVSTRPYRARDSKDGGVYFSQDGETVVARAEGGKQLNWWRFTGGGGPAAWLEFPDPVNVTFLPGGGKVCIMSRGQQGKPIPLRAEVYDLSTRERKARIETPRPVQWPFLSIDRRAGVSRFENLRFPILGAVEANVARVWDLESGRLIREIFTPGLLEWGLFSPEGRRILTVSIAHELMVWDLFTGAPLLGEPLKYEGYPSIEFSPDGEKLLVHDRQKRILQVWDSRSGQRIVEPIEQEYLSYTFFTDEGRKLLVQEAGMTSLGTFTRQTHGKFRLLDIGLRPILFEELPEGTEMGRFTGRGEEAVLVGSARQTDPEQLLAWDTAARRARISFTLPQGVRRSRESLALSPDGSRVLLGSSDGKTRVWDLAAGKLLHELAGQAAVSAVTVSPDGTRAATGTVEGKARIWDLATGAPLCEPLDHGPREIREVRFSPDGLLLASGSVDWKCRVADGRTGEARFPPLALDNIINSLVFSPDGAYLVPVPFSSEIPIVETATGKVVRKLPHNDSCRIARFSPDGSLLATGTGAMLQAPEGRVYLWNWREGRTAGRPLEVRGPVQHLEFTADGALLVTGTVLTGRGAAQVWDVATGRALTDPVVGRMGVTSVDFNHQGTSLIVGWGDGTARFIDLPPRVAPVPGWLPGLSEAVARKRISGSSGTEAVPASELERLRSELAAPGGAALVQRAASPLDSWARWFFADPEERTISPGSAVTFSQHLARLRRSARTEDLQEALRLAPSDALTCARLGLVLLDSLASRGELDRQKEVDERLKAHWKETAAWYTRRAVELKPGEAEAWALRAEALERLERRAEAKAAVASALELDPSRAEPTSPNARYLKAVTLGGEGKWSEADEAFRKALEGVSTSRLASRPAEAQVPLLGVLAGLEPARAPAGFRDIRLPPPIPGTFEDFETTPEGRTPRGWTARHEPVESERSWTASGRLDVPDSDVFEDWTVVSLERAASAGGGPYFPDTSLNPATRERLEGGFLAPLLRGRFLYSLSAERGTSQVHYLFTPDYDCSGRSGVHLAFHSSYEQSGSTVASLEYSIDEGKSWLPILYRMNAAQVAYERSGKIDAEGSLGKEGFGTPLFIGEDGLPRGSSCGAFLGAKVSRGLDPFLEPMRRDDAVEGKRLEVFRLPGADRQPKVRLRFAHAGRYGWYWAIDDLGLYEIKEGQAASQPEVLDRTSDPRVLAGLGIASILGSELSWEILDPRSFKKATVVGPEPEAAPPGAAHALRRQAVDGSLLIRRAAALAPEDPWVLLAAALAAARVGAVDEALATARRALAREPVSVLSAPPLAAVFLLQGDSLKEKGDPQAAGVAYELAEALSRTTGKTDSAILKRLVELGFSAPGTVLLPRGSEWRFLDDGSDPGPGWKEPALDDSLWLRGKARLGYGGDGEVTVLGFGPDPKKKYMAAYFRTAIEVADPSTFAHLKATLQRDDGAAVYLNGRELLRDNMPAGTIGPGTRAERTVDGEEEKRFFTFDLPAAGLRKGRNVIAAEVHQRDETSSDLGFDLELEGIGALKEVARVPAELEAIEERLGMIPELRSALWTSRAQRYRLAGELDRAADALDRAARLGPDNPAHLHERALLLLARGEAEAAYQAYLRAAGAAIALKAGPRSHSAAFLPESLKAAVEPVAGATGLGLAAAADRVVKITGSSSEVEARWLLRWSETLDRDGQDARQARVFVLIALGKDEEALAIVDQGAAAGVSGPAATARALREHLDWFSLRERCLRRLKRNEEADRVRDDLRKTPPRDPRLGARQIDLSAYYNASLRGGGWHGSENLRLLPETFRPRGGVEFDIRGLIQVNSGVFTEGGAEKGKDLNGLLLGQDRSYPDAVKGIAVGLETPKLHFLLGCIYGFGKAGTEIGRMVIHYQEGETVEIPLRLGEDLIDWAQLGQKIQADRVAWLGGRPVRGLLSLIWSNPSPAKRIKELDLVSSKTAGAPFLVAITAE